MNPMKHLLTLAVLGVGSVFVYSTGSSLIKDVQFALAEERVEATRAELSTIQDLSGVFKKINKALEKSVVHVRVEKRTPTIGRGMPDLEDELFRRFFDRDGDGEPDFPQRDFSQIASGSGVIMEVADGYGYVVTNNHVIDGQTKLTVVLEDGREINDVEVVGTDPKTDVAVLKIKADRLIPATWGDSDTLEKGDIIVAFGSPFGYVGSMSHGIVSALNRQAGVISSSFAYENFIQVDAPINPGNSGGPLVNLKGEVVGINTAIATRSGSFSGVGFAIPSNQVKSVYESLKSSGKVVRGYLGVQIADVKAASSEIRDNLASIGYDGENGVLVRQVMRDSPAYRQLQPGDVIVKLNGKPVNSMTDLRNRIAMTPPGQEVKLTVWRDKQTQEITVKLAEQPDDQSVLASTRDELQRNQQIGVGITTPTESELEAAGLPTDAKGALVRSVQPMSLAARAGIRPGDLITRIGEKEIRSAEDAKEALRQVDFSKGVRIDLVNREGEKMVTIRQSSR